MSRRNTKTNKYDENLKSNNWKSFLSIFSYVLPYKWTFAIGMVFLVLSTLATLSFPYIIKMLSDSALADAGVTSNSSDTAEALVNAGDWGLTELAGLLVVLLLLQGVFSYFRIYLFAYVSENAMADIRKDLYQRLVSLSIPFFESRRVGELTSRIAADVTQLQSAISINLAEFFRQIATILIGILIIVFLSPRLTLVMLCTFPIGIIGAMIFGRFIRKLSRRSQDALANANVVVEETLQNIQIVKAFTNERLEIKRYDTAINKVVRFAMKAATYRGAFVSFLISVVFGVILLVTWYGFFLVERGSMSVGELISFVIYTFFIGAAIGGMGDLYGSLQRAMGASERVLQLLEEEPEVDVSHKIDTTASTLVGDISYKNVYFNYPTRPDVTVLKGVSLHIKQGEKIALVGSSGAGKSTIVQLLNRFYNIDSGNITVAGKAIQQYNISDLRAGIGIVPQEVILFGGSIRENIAYGKAEGQDISDALIIEAAKKANAWDFIQKFPEGLDTLVGERGVKLSGGQRQRIAIARAILKDPAILVLDEATSSLDAESEKLVQDALDKLMENRTTIIIAHRLATIRKVNQIYVLENGKIVEQGTHLELADKPQGIYQNLLRLQFDVVE